ncbi:oligosaccharide flippase family protein [Vibrio sp. Of7-15]|nr:oligosaccharide flippase family protein [Vibrio sp. Of7-15]
MQKGIGLLLLPFTTSYLSVTEFGILETILITLSLISLLEIAGGALPRFYSLTTTDNERCQLLTSAVLVSLCYGAILSLIIWLSFDVLLSIEAELEPSIKVIVACTVWVMMLQPPFYIWIRIEERSKEYFYLSITQSLTQVILSIGLLSSGFGIKSILIASLLSNSIGLILSYGFCRHKLSGAFDLSLIIKIIRYQSYMIAASLCMFAVQGFDRLLLSNLLGPSLLASYAITMKIMEMVATVVGAIETWWMPKRFEVVKDKANLDRALYLHQQLIISTLSVIFLGTAVGFTLVTLVTPVEYHASLIYLPILCLAFCWKLLTGIVDVGCYISENPVSVPMVNFSFAVIALGLYFFTIKEVGILGLVITLNLIFLGRFLVFLVLSQKRVYISYSYHKLIPLFIFMIIASVASVTYIPTYFYGGYFLIVSVLILLYGVMSKILDLEPLLDWLFKKRRKING